MPWTATSIKTIGTYSLSVSSEPSGKLSDGLSETRDHGKGHDQHGERHAPDAGEGEDGERFVHEFVERAEAPAGVVVFDDLFFQDVNRPNAFGAHGRQVFGLEILDPGPNLPAHLFDIGGHFCSFSECRSHRPFSVGADLSKFRKKQFTSTHQ